MTREPATVGARALFGAVLILVGATIALRIARPVPVGGGEPLPTLVLDVNSAPAAHLCLLPGIGPALADAIVAERERAPFRDADDLARVHRIGPRTIERLRPHVGVGPEVSG